MEYSKKKYIVISIIITGIVLFLVLLIYFISQQSNTDTTNQVQQLPTSPQQEPQESLSPNPSISPPTTPEPNTGAIDPDFTALEIEEINQERILRKRSPYKGNGFLLQYDAANDIFRVALEEDKTSSRSSFDIWIQSNYPAILNERFTIE